MRNIVFVVTLAILVSACGPPSVQDLADNPKLLERVVAECQKEMARGASLSEKCENAQKAVLERVNEAVADAMGDLLN